MTPGKLYIKIFLSFVLILVVAEILIFGLFIFSTGKSFRSRIGRYTGGKALIAKELIEDKIRAEPGVDLAQNASLRRAIRRFGDSFGALIWLTTPEGTVELKSFAGDIPGDVARLRKRRYRDFDGLKLYHDFRGAYSFLATIPIGMGRGEVGHLHVLFKDMESPHPKGAFALGLIGIGLVIALLVFPVSRLITERVKRLRHSALRIAEGDLSHRAVVKGKDEIGELARSFNRMADRLERMIRGGRELTANISHELRSPLARIRVAQELLREKWVKGDYGDWKRQMNEIETDIEELDILIDRILVLSKLDIHEAPMNPEPVDPVALIEEILKRLRPSITRKRLGIVTELSFDPPFQGDREGLRTALSNILDNAVKFTPEEGRIYVKMHPGEDQLSISVQNSFHRLAEEDLAAIFEPFFRADRTMKTGSGLGLAITKKIIERHGGRIEALNSEAGLEIRLGLPREQG